MAKTTHITETVKKDQSEFSRTIECNQISTFDPIHWISLGIQDMIKAPVVSLVFGALFALIAYGVFKVVAMTGNHLIILPATIAVAFIGPIFATGLYDAAWEIEKGHQPSVRHSVKAMFRNPVNEWGFAIILMVTMIAWTRIAALIHALYPNTVDPSIEEMLAFLTLGTLAGAILSAAVFTMSVFTPQTLMERRVDVMTAISTSVNAVMHNIGPMILWAVLICAGIVISFMTLGLGFIVIMPVLSYASWHAYIATVKTKRDRNYE